MALTVGRVSRRRAWFAVEAGGDAERSSEK